VKTTPWTHFQTCPVQLLALFDACGREVWHRAVRDGWQFALPFLPGDYRVEWTDGRGRVVRQSLHLGASGADLRGP